MFGEKISVVSSAAMTPLLLRLPRGRSTTRPLCDPAEWRAETLQGNKDFVTGAALGLVMTSGNVPPGRNQIFN